MPIFSRPSDSSSPRSGSQSSRTSGASSAIPGSGGTTNSPATPVTSVPASNTPQAPKKTSTSTSRRTNSEEETAPATNSGSSQPKVLLSELQNFLSGLQPADLAAGGASGGQNRGIDLSTAINAEAVDKISSPEHTDALVAHLPTIESSANAKQQLKDTIQSPQFQQALSMFSTALQSGQLGPVVSQFELNPEAVAAANTGDLEQFVRALEKHAESIRNGSAAIGTSSTDSKKKEEKEKDKETPMEEDKNA